MNFYAKRVKEAASQARYEASVAPKDKRGNAARMHHVSMCAMTGKHREAVETCKEILRHDPECTAAATWACNSQILTDGTTKDWMELQKHLIEASFRPVAKRLHPNGKDPERPLRVGYVSDVFRGQSASRIFSRVLCNHTNSIVPYFYSTLPINYHNDASYLKFKEIAGDRWRDISLIGDDEAADLVWADKIDILVNLSGLFLLGGRLPVFARKPAPVQVSSVWGFVAGTGLPEMDWCMADEAMVPMEERRLFVEKIHDLPCAITLNPDLMPGDDVPVVDEGKPLPSLKGDTFTFGNFSRACKLSDGCVDAFASVLRLVPGSRLVFKDSTYEDTYVRSRIMDRMKGIDPSRIEFHGGSLRPAHLRSMRCCDLMLDSFPHVAGAVSLETLWMGVPMITLYGRQPGGRMTSSVLTAIGRTEWITRTAEGYVEKVVTLAKDPAALAEAGKALRGEIERTIVDGYPEAVEKAYRLMWREWCSKT